MGIMACFVDYALWGGNTKLETIMNKLKQVFRIGTKNKIKKYSSISVSN